MDDSTIGRSRCFSIGGGNFNIFDISTPNFGEDEPILTFVFFQLGWFNHQLVFRSFGREFFQVQHRFNGDYWDLNMMKRDVLAKQVAYSNVSTTFLHNISSRWMMTRSKNINCQLCCKFELFLLMRSNRQPPAWIRIHYWHKHLFQYSQPSSGTEGCSPIFNDRRYDSWNGQVATEVCLSCFC